MLITMIQITRLESSITKLKGIANITLDGMVAIHDIKILQHNHDIFLAMPSKKTKAKAFKDIVHPINSEVRTIFEKLIFFAYEEADKKHYTYLEMCIIDGHEIDNLLDQRTEHFKIANFSTTSFQKKSRFESKETINKKQEVESTIDESLMKWLES